MGKKSLGEKEQDLLEALRVRNNLAFLQSHVDSILLITSKLSAHTKGITHVKMTGDVHGQAFYYDEAPTMSNEEFDNLKEELLWAGSQVAILR